MFKYLYCIYSTEKINLCVYIFADSEKDAMSASTKYNVKHLGIVWQCEYQEAIELGWKIDKDTITEKYAYANLPYSIL